ncbi:DUF3703 domain-containing protein [Gallaecimonas sp. GXIMD4217]|uniref:DUF3703 domain-containing protein n=1 Tax=Gallaecimonas sp. GXIMD4217 TaxID=3131927 RepID=UPI00311B35E4
MQSNFTRRIRPFVEVELAQAAEARAAGDPRGEFSHLERAHVLGQASTYWHTRVHVLMLGWAMRQGVMKEFLGQLLRIAGAASKTALGLVPRGNTGGANVSPFQVMPIEPALAAQIDKAKSGS